MPARNEALSIGGALGALRRAAEAAGGPAHVVVVDDASRDDTAELARAALRDWPHGNATVIAGPGSGVGWARRAGFEHALGAAERAGVVGRAGIASTDADSAVPPHWFSALRTLLENGHPVIAGDIELEPGTDPALRAARERRLAHRLAHVRAGDPAAEHPHFAGANLAWSAAALAGLGPLPAPPSLEDDALRRRCEALGLPILRDASFAVRTSARLDGRAPLGLASALRADAARLAAG
jgi:glycosyltransferase involved in cell wall biosynthesis